MTDDTLRVSEVFFSIQGEGTRSGLPCGFVRLAGCDLECTYCDTLYARTGGQDVGIDQIMAELGSFGCDLVQITGGEPLLQSNVHLLMARLCEAGKCVLLETNGACDISTCDRRVVKIMDLKTPGSGQEHRNLWSNIDHLAADDEVKFIICDRADYDWARKVIGSYDLPGRTAAVSMSPAAALDADGGSTVSLRDLARWILADHLPVRLQVQLHRLIWGPHERGV